MSHFNNRNINAEVTKSGSVYTTFNQRLSMSALRDLRDILSPIQLEYIASLPWGRFCLVGSEQEMAQSWAKLNDWLRFQ